MKVGSSVFVMALVAGTAIKYDPARSLCDVTNDQVKYSEIPVEFTLSGDSF